jgi:hypothetical protein
MRFINSFLNCLIDWMYIFALDTFISFIIRCTNFGMNFKTRQGVYVTSGSTDHILYSLIL